MNLREERETFEFAWNEIYSGCGEFFLRHHKLNDQYANMDTQRAWEGWQARAALACGDLNERPIINLCMTLRDYFAAKALQGICASSTGNLMTDDAIANGSYSIADAMLLAANTPANEINQAPEVIRRWQRRKSAAAG